MSERIYDRLYIGGEWVVPHSGRAIASIDPSTETVWAEVAEADETDIDKAVEAAKAAMRGPWKTKITASQRGALLPKLAELVRRDAARLAELESRDNGKPLRDTVGEVQRAVDWLTYFAGAADKIQGEQIPIRANALAYTRREPVGVVGAVLPWNSPILLYSWKMGPALAAGNAMVLKPAEQTPVTALEIAKLVAEAGFPGRRLQRRSGLRGNCGSRACGASRRQQDLVYRQPRHRAQDHAARIRQSEALHLRMRREIAAHHLRRRGSRARSCGGDAVRLPLDRPILFARLAPLRPAADL